MLEGLAREVIRHVQTTRKEAGMEIADRIFLFLASEDLDLTAAIPSPSGIHQQRDAGNSSGRKSVGRWSV